MAHGARVIGVVLTGTLDDGTAGFMAIKRCGSVTVVQDPRDAAYSGMPVNALNNVEVDFCVSVAEMGPLLTTLVSQPHGKSKAVPSDIRTEALIAERVLSDVSQVNGLGDHRRARLSGYVAERIRDPRKACDGFMSFGNLVIACGSGQSQRSTRRDGWLPPCSPPRKIFSHGPA